MPRKDGVFGKMLNFIGLVDDGDPRDSYSQDDYEEPRRQRPSTYVPERTRSRSAQTTRPRQEMTRRSSGSTYTPARTAGRAPARSSYESRYEPTKRPSPAQAPRRHAFVERVEEEKPRYDYSPRPTGRFGGFEETEERSVAPRANMNRRRPGGSSSARTVMYTLHELKECTEVIDHLIESNIVFLTLDDMDPRMMQRAVDTLSGAVFALQATIRKATERTYVIAPANVEVDVNSEEDDDYYY